MAKPKLRFFKFREIGNAVELIAHFTEVTPEVESEAISVFAMLYYQTRNHIKLDLYTVNYLPMSFLTRILNLAIELRERKRVLILYGISPSLYHFLHRFSLQDNIYLQREGLIRKLQPTHLSTPATLPTKEETPDELPDLPKAEGV